MLRSQVHGWTVDAPWSLGAPALPEAPVDVSIRMGPAPESLGDDTDAPLQVVGRRCLLRVPGVGRFLIENDATITIAPEDAARATEVITFLSGSVMALLGHLRRRLVLHGSAVATPAGAVLLLGHSGRGKSTLAMALHARGYPALSDDVVAVAFEQSVPVTFPGVPLARLWADALDRLGRIDAGFDHVRPGIEKYVVPFQPPEGASFPVHSIWALDVMTGDHAEPVLVSTVNGGAGVLLLTELTRNRRFLDRIGETESHFLQAAHLAQRVPLYRLTRSSRTDSVADVVAAVESTFG